MGRYYSEAIDDNNQIIHMRFGQPMFNSLTTFFTGFYDPGMSRLARTGRTDTILYKLGTAAGFVVSILNWKLLAVHLIGVAMRFALEKPASKFYYMKPAMPLYWNAVTTIVNQIAVNKGIVPRIGDKETTNHLNKGYEFTDNDKTLLHNSMPNIFDESGSIDVYAIANKAQRMARVRNEKMQQALDKNVDPNTIFSRMRSVLNEAMDVSGYPPLKLASYLDKWFESAPAKPTVPKSDGQTTNDGNTSSTANATTNPSGANSTGANTEDKPNTDSTVYKEDFDKDLSKWDKFAEFMKAEMDDGSWFASFRVNPTGAVSESFSNSVGDSEIANKINGMSASSRSTQFNFAGGNLGGAIGTMLNGVMGAVSDVASGIANGLGISGIAALGGAAFVDIPKYWQSSAAQLPRASYTINLVSPYGNPISQLTNIYIPLAMLLAGALPLSTGKQSYTSPFLVELYDRGRCQTRLGMIDSISITRGTGNLPFNNDSQCMAIDVSFSVIDLSSVMHMPIVENFKFKDALVAAGNAVGGEAGAIAAAGISGAFDDDTVFSDYMNILGSVSLFEQVYPYQKLKLQLTRRITNFRSWASVSHFTSFLGDTWPVRLIGIPFRGTVK